MSLLIQAGSLKSFFPGSKVIRNKELSLTWKGVLKPTPLSQEYLIELNYHKDNGVRVFVRKPERLSLFKGKESLPHVYSTEDQRLCLYYPGYKEWNTSQLYVDSLIPWTSEWLMHYELWLSIGVWLGGGKHDDPTEKEVNT